jgi:ribosomal protein S18 acetylase RimI-like enzyme
MADDGGFERPPCASVHPDHDELTRELRRWFTTSAPEIGYRVEELWCGHLSELGGDMGARLLLGVATPDQVPAALDDARKVCGSQEITVWVDDRARAARLDEALRSCGCQPGTATTHLALVGPMADQRGPEHLVIENVGQAGLAEWATVKLQCFGDTESPPAQERLAIEIAVRQVELALADYKLGTIDGEPVAVLAYYRGSDQLVFNLGTRMPYRHRGIAQAMLAHWVDAGRADGCRSMIINAEEAGRPAALYRRLGFVDEIYWYRKYLLEKNVMVGTPQTQASEP